MLTVPSKTERSLHGVLMASSIALLLWFGLPPPSSFSQGPWSDVAGERPGFQPRKRSGLGALQALAEHAQGAATLPSPVGTRGAPLLVTSPSTSSLEAQKTLRELRRVGVLPRGLSLREPTRWPAEPEAPASWDGSRFISALLALCPVTRSPDSVSHYAREMLRSAQELGVDPSLLAALTYQQSGCDAQRSTAWGTGLTMLHEGLFPRSLRSQRAYRYGQLQDGRWAATDLPLPRFAFAVSRFRDASENIYFAAALLRVFQTQCPDIDGPFRARPHRHFVSHFIWGDAVQDAGAEDRVLTARRRFLAHYLGAQAQVALVPFRELSLGSPLDGPPRIAHHGLGEMRDHGRRPHLGVDFISSFGEPVRAVADGTVRYAGTDTTDGRLLNVDPAHAARIPRQDMGPRGLFVRIDHASEVHSIYAHLAEYTVHAGQKVRRGDLLGYVGRTGIQDSDPHLHFGLFEMEQVVDPTLALRGLLFGPGDLLRPVPVAGHAAVAPQTTPRAPASRAAP